MTLTTSLRSLSLLLLTLTTLSSGSGVLVHPSERGTYRCNPRTNDPRVQRPYPMSCAVAVTQLPESVEGVDWHRGRRIGDTIYDHPLTETGDPASDSHLPQQMIVGGCRVRVELSPGVLSADMIWTDVKIFALQLVRRCVGDERMIPPMEGPGTGGVFEYGGVRISVVSVGPGRLVVPSRASSSSLSGLSRSDSSWSSSQASDRAEGVDSTA
ncbi:hypothetical protein MMC16_007310 [Acarospora aff. strigata]|nr:hypothetical protein [Acarospora aff. strigata]